MSLFGTILAKLGLKKEAAAPPPPTTTVPQAPTTAPQPAGMSVEPTAAPPVSVAPAVPPPVSVVDVVAMLAEAAASNPQKLNWKTSIVDLLKILNIDSSYTARKELATELGCPEKLMGDSAQMNTWLHKTVLQRIADNGGNIPGDLLG